MKKRLILALCLALLFSSASALADGHVGDVQKVDNLTYTLLKDGTWAVTDCEPEAVSASILPELEGRPVTVIQSAFSNCYDLTEVAIPEGVAVLGTNAFHNCCALTHILLPASLTQIPGNPFVCCEKLTDIQVAPGNPALEVVDGVLFNKLERRLICYPLFFSETEYAVPVGTRSIGTGAFSLSGKKSAPSLLRRVIVPEGVTVIGDYAFQSCELDSLELPESLVAVGYLALPEHPSRMMTLSGNVAYLSTEDMQYHRTPFRVDADSYAQAYLTVMKIDCVVRGSEDAESWRPATVVNCDEWISLRSMASTESSREAKIPLGALVEVLPTDGEFWYCRYQNKMGYALAKYLELD